MLYLPKTFLSYYVAHLCLNWDFMFCINHSYANCSDVNVFFVNPRGSNNLVWCQAEVLFDLGSVRHLKT